MTEKEILDKIEELGVFYIHTEGPIDKEFLEAIIKSIEEVEELKCLD